MSAGVGERLQRRPGVVDVAGRAVRAEAEAAIGVLLALDPASRFADRDEPGECPTARSAKIANAVRLTRCVEGVVALARAQHFGDEVAAGERVRGGSARVHGEDRALGVAETLSVEASARSESSTRVAVATDARRIAPGGGQAHRRPRGVQLAGGLPVRAAEAAVGVLRGGQEGELGREASAAARACAA